MATAVAKTEGKSVFYVYGGLGGKKIRDLNCQEGEAEEKRKNQHGRVKHWNKFPGNFQEGGAGHVQPVSRSRAR